MSQFVRHIFSSLLLAGIVTALICLEPFSARQPATDKLLFDVHLTATAEGTAHLFFDDGSGFGAHPSAPAKVSAGPQIAHFLVPPGVYRAFRFEGAEPSGSVKIAGARVVDLAGHEIAHFEPSQFGAGGELVCTPPLVLRSAFAWSRGETGGVFALIALCSALALWRLEPWLGKWRAPFAAALSRVAAQARSHPVLTILATAAAAVVVSCHPVIFAGKSFVTPENGVLCLYADFPTLPGVPAGPVENPKSADLGAMLWAHLPYSVAEHRAIFHDHELPLWNRANSCGVPLLGQGQSMIGDPLHWIPLCAGGAAWAWDVKFVLAKILFAFGIGLLVRAAVGRLGIAAALAASSAFIGFFAYRFNHAAIFSLSYAPWLLLAWLEIVRASAWRGAARWVALLIAANWIELNSGTAKEASMLIVALNGTGVLALLVSRETWRAKARKLTLAAAGLLIFLLLSAPCWLVFLDALASAWTNYSVPHAYQIQPSLLLGLFDGLFYGQSVADENHTNPSVNFFILLGVLWALAHARQLGADRTFLALALPALAALALVFGVVPPGFITRLPFVRNIAHVDNTFSCVLIVLLFPLAAFGLKVCRERMADASWRGDWMVTLLLAATLCALFFGFIQAETRLRFGQIPAARQLVMSPFFGGYATALLVAVALLPLIARRLLHARAWTLANVLLATLGLFALHFRHGMYVATKFDRYVMNPQERVDLAAPSSAVEQVKTHSPEPVRATGFDEVLSPGFNSVLGLENIAGPDALANARYRGFVDAAKLPVVWDWRLAVGKSTVPTLLPLYDFLNLRYYLGTPGAGPAVVVGLKRVGTSDLDLYESPAVWPRAFFTDTLASYQTADEFAQMIWSGDRRPFAAMQAGTASAGGLPSALAARQAVPATDYRLTSNTTTFAIDATARGLAVLSAAYEEGNFRVTVNGMPAPCLRVNHAFCGVPIPQAGHFIVRFEYWPRRLTLALWLAAAGLALLAAGTAWLRLSRPAPAA